MVVLKILMLHSPSQKNLTQSTVEGHHISPMVTGNSLHEIQDEDDSVPDNNKSNMVPDALVQVTTTTLDDDQPDLDTPSLPKIPTPKSKGPKEQSRLIHTSPVKLSSRKPSVAKPGFACSQCSSTYTDKNSLMRHLMDAHAPQYGVEDQASDDSLPGSPTEEGLLACSECEASFTKESQLTRHFNQSHRWFCSQCEMQFCSKKQLKKHNKSAHFAGVASTRYSCSHCSLSFSSESKLSFHKMKSHKRGEIKHVKEKKNIAKDSPAGEKKSPFQVKKDTLRELRLKDALKKKKESLQENNDIFNDIKAAFKETKNIEKEQIEPTEDSLDNVKDIDGSVRNDVQTEDMEASNKSPVRKEPDVVTDVQDDSLIDNETSIVDTSNDINMDLNSDYVNANIVGDTEMGDVVVADAMLDEDPCIPVGISDTSYDESKSNNERKIQPNADFMNDSMEGRVPINDVTDSEIVNEYSSDISDNLVIDEQQPIGAKKSKINLSSQTTHHSVGDDSSPSDVANSVGGQLNKTSDFSGSTEHDSHSAQAEVIFPPIPLHNCRKCDDKFGSMEELIDHIEEAHETPSKYCPVCNLPGYDYATMVSHFVQHHCFKKSGTCVPCQRRFDDLPRLKKHAQGSHINKVFNKCKICEMGFDCPSRLYMHMDKVHSHNVLLGQYKAGHDRSRQLDIISTKRREIERQQQILEKQKQLLLKLESQQMKSEKKVVDLNVLKEFDSPQFEKEAVKAISKSSPRVSHPSPSMFSSPVKLSSQGMSTLGKKKSRTSIPSMEPIMCMECGESKNGMESLVQHFTQEHTRNDNFCYPCNRIFEELSRFRRHTRYHCEKARYRCTICGQTYDRSNNLYKHMASAHKSYKTEENIDYQNSTPKMSNNISNIPTSQSVSPSASGGKKGFGKIKLSIPDPSEKGGELSSVKDILAGVEVQPLVPPDYLCRTCGDKFKSLPALDKHQLSDHSVRMGTSKRKSRVPTKLILDSDRTPRNEAQLGTNMAALNDSTGLVSDPDPLMDNIENVSIMIGDPSEMGGSTGPGSFGPVFVPPPSPERRHGVHVISSYVNMICDSNNCQKQFNSYFDYVDHYFSAHGENLMCLTCGKPFPDQDKYDHHIRGHVRKQRFLCHLCHVGFDRADKVFPHMRRMHNTTVELDEGKHLAEAARRRPKVRTESSLVSYNPGTSNALGRSFQSKSTFKSLLHKNTYSINKMHKKAPFKKHPKLMVNKTYTCKYCHFKCPNKSVLFAHVCEVKNAVESTPVGQDGGLDYPPGEITCHKCDICFINYDTLDEAEAHQKEAHDITDPPFYIKRLKTCPICMVAVLASNYTRHQERAHPEYYASYRAQTRQERVHRMKVKKIKSRQIINKQISKISNQHKKFQMHFKSRGTLSSEGLVRPTKYAPSGLLKMRLADFPDTDELLNCEYCDESIAGRLMHRHLRQQHPTKLYSYQCPVCKIWCCTGSSINRHIVVKHGNICEDMVTGDQGVGQYHMSNFAGVRSKGKKSKGHHKKLRLKRQRSNLPSSSHWRCSHCGRTFFSKCNLERHHRETACLLINPYPMKELVSETPPAPPIEVETESIKEDPVTSNGNLSVSAGGGASDKVCSYCSRVFANSSNVCRHQRETQCLVINAKNRQHLDPPPQPVVKPKEEVVPMESFYVEPPSTAQLTPQHFCSVCNRGFVNRGNLQRHIVQVDCVPPNQSTATVQQSTSLLSEVAAASQQRQHQELDTIDSPTIVDSDQVLESNTPGPIKVFNVDDKSNVVAKTETFEESTGKSSKDKPADDHLYCDICGISFERSIGMVLHDRFIHGIVTLPVKQRKGKRGSESAEGESAMDDQPPTKQQKLDEVSDSAVEKLQCPQCPKMFSNASTMAIHAKYSHGQHGVILCEVCNQGVYHVQYASHMARHELAKRLPTADRPEGMERTDLPESVDPALFPYSCDLCGELFAERDELRDHQTADHDASERSNHRCSICSVAFASDTNLSAHTADAHADCGAGIQRKSSVFRGFGSPSANNGHDVIDLSALLDSDEGEMEGVSKTTNDVNRRFSNTDSRSGTEVRSKLVSFPSPNTRLMKPKTERHLPLSPVIVDNCPTFKLTPLTSGEKCEQPPVFTSRGRRVIPKTWLE